MAADVRVTVEFMGPFEFDFGVAVTHLALPEPATIGNLLEALALRWPAAQSLWSALGADSLSARYCYVSVDYHAVAPEAVLGTSLHDGARVCFAVPMAGG